MLGTSWITWAWTHLRRPGTGVLLLLAHHRGKTTCVLQSTCHNVAIAACPGHHMPVLADTFSGVHRGLHAGVACLQLDGSMALGRVLLPHLYLHPSAHAFPWLMLTSIAALQRGAPGVSQAAFRQGLRHRHGHSGSGVDATALK